MSRTLLLSIMTSAIIFLALFNKIFTEASPDLSSGTQIMIKNPPENQSLFSKTIEQQATTDEEETSNSTSLLVLQLLANILETRINGTAALLELTSKLPEVRNAHYVNSITEEFMGISQNLDSEKRKIAQYILEQNKDIASIFFLTPTGDIYIGEPFSDQKQLPKLNYADRDWYKGVTKLNDTYVSAVFLSAAIHATAIAIAVPIYENNIGNDVDNNNNNNNGVGYSLSPILGYWVGIVDLSRIKEDIAALGFRSESGRILIVDHNGTQVLDTIDRNLSSSSQPSSGPSSSSSSKNQELKSFSYLESVNRALNGERGSVTEMINGTTMTIQYYPLQVTPHIWAALLIKPS
jgi:Cache domain